jgi:N-acetylglucosamine-6-sulfatase
LGGYVVAEAHRDLYRDAIFPPKPNMLTPAEVAKDKPAWAHCHSLRESDESKAILTALHSMEQEEIRLRARMMASVDEGIGEILAALERTGELDNTCIVFLGDNGFFFGEHALGPSVASRTRKGFARLSSFAIRRASAPVHDGASS